MMQSDLATSVYHAFSNLFANGLSSGFDPVGRTVCLVLLLIPCLYYFVIGPMAFGPLSHVPGPTLCKLLRYYLSYFNISLQRTNNIYEWHARYGPVICIGPGEVSLATPSLMREIYGNSGGYAKSKFFDQFVAYGERAVFAIRPYAAHRQRRKMIASFYNNVNKPTFERSIIERVNAIINQIDGEQDQTSLDVFSLASHYAFDNISRLLYGKSHCSHVIETDGKERRILADLKKAQLLGPFQLDFPGLYGLVKRLLSPLAPVTALFHADDDLICWNYGRITEIVAGRRAAKDEEDTLFHHLLSARNPDGTLLSLNYIASELYDNLNAAQMTVGTTLTYIIYHLSENPKWQTKICNEILSLPSEVNGFPSFASINSAPILEAFIREVYRVNPGTGGHAERVVPDGGKVYHQIYIPGGVRVTASTTALHRDTTVFYTPSAFDPDRWFERSPEQARLLDRSLIPFGYGARICAGRLFATMEIKLLIARLYTRYSTRVDPFSKTTRQSMVQCATHDSVPRGLRCDVSFQLLEKGNEN